MMLLTMSATIIFSNFNVNVLAAENSGMEETTIPHTKTSGSNNFFKFSENGWEDGDSEHKWSKEPSTTLPASEIWYEVHFVGSKIDIYAGKNKPMGTVEYFIDGESKGEFSLYNSSNINSTLITSFEGLSEEPHVLKAVATGEKDTNSTKALIDCAKVIVYHEPYTVNDITVSQESFTLLKGATQQIEYTVNPDYVEISDLAFTSADENIATVDNKGIVTAVANGSTEITLKSEKYNVTKTVCGKYYGALPG